MAPKPKTPAKAAPKAPAKAPAKVAAKPKPVAKKDDKKKAKPAKSKPVAKSSKPQSSKAKKEKRNQEFDALFVSRPKNLKEGVLPFKKDLKRVVRWPGYISRSRGKATLLKRLKVPPAINQFKFVARRSLRTELYKFARKYKPESRLERRKRLRGEAKKKVKEPSAPHTVKKFDIKSGAQRVSRLVEQKRAKLVLIANDVDPLEIVIWLPSLCKKLGVPYVIVQNKAALGKLVRRKTATCIAFTNIKNEDKGAFDKLVESANKQFADQYEEQRKHWGGRILSSKTKYKIEADKRRRAAAQAKREGR
eukprot:NODE_5391_length_1020_cov_60.652174_g4822_i0.p1 GENE.NODE_5391_length_1020_cov_60.652174_g4822_i0~~NODE_5391_length_1020_cov_60.652174_g4822_i0.p1  ORF type:complete len:306 (-),score=69.63 NODE_5391_length_1020_cov_60.652174_g4822_i0:58-975(-)